MEITLSAFERKAKKAGRKRSASSDQQDDRPASKRFQEDSVQGGDGILGADSEQSRDAVQKAVGPALLIRQNTFTKEDGGVGALDGDDHGGGTNRLYFIPIELEGNVRRREALRKRFADREAARIHKNQEAIDEAKSARDDVRSRTTAGGRGGGKKEPLAKSSVGSRAESAPIQMHRVQDHDGGLDDVVRDTPPLQRQGTFTVEEDGEVAKVTPLRCAVNIDDESPAADLTGEGRGRGAQTALKHDEVVDNGPSGLSVTAGDLNSNSNNNENPDSNHPGTVAELRAALSVLRRGRAAAERSERAARERAARDADRTRAALRDLHQRLAATRVALHAEKDGLHRKLSADFRAAVRDREALWRQERERLQAQVQTLDAEVRTLRARLGAVQADTHRKTVASEAELRRAWHDQEAALRAQLADTAKQRDNLQAQLSEELRASRASRAASRTSRPANRASRASGVTEAHAERPAIRAVAVSAARKGEYGRRALQLEAQQQCRMEVAKVKAEADRERVHLEARLEEALRALRALQQRNAPSGHYDSDDGEQTTTPALESHREGVDGVVEASPHTRRPEELLFDADDRTQSNKRRRRQQRKDQGGGGGEGKEEGEEEETLENDKQRDDHCEDGERRLRHVQEVESLRRRNAALKESLRGAAWRRHPLRRRPQNQSSLRRVRKTPRRPAQSWRKQSSNTNVCGRGDAPHMRHFQRLISLEPVSEADEYPAGGEGLGPLGGLGGIGGSRGAALGGSLESPLSSEPSSLSPTPGIGDVWNDLAVGCTTTSSGGSPCSPGASSGSASPGEESLGALGGLGRHAVLYWQLMRDHLQLQRAYQQMQQLQASSRSNDRQARAKLEAQVYDLKRALSRRPSHGPSHGAALSDALQDVVELRQREQSLTAELAELRDQNELLEFRLLELEGIVDKSSLCSGTSGGSGGGRTRDVCMDTESDTVTEDSGLLSLGASDDGEVHSESLAVRERLSLLASSLQAEEDRGCLQRALQLLDSYQQQLNKHGAAAKGPSQRIVATVLPYTEAAEDADDTLGAAKQSSREEFRRKQEFLSQMQSRLGHGHIGGGNSNNAKKTLKQSDCLQESGIFEADPEDGVVVGDLASTATQTDSWSCGCHHEAALAEAPFSSLPPFGSAPPTGTPPVSAATATAVAGTGAGALSAEIQKLSQIRERFEEQASVTKLKLSESPSLTSTSPCGGAAAVSMQQLQLKLRELEFFRARAASLEEKLAELERCSDPELRGCARLLERVAALERQAREAREAADLLVRRNRDLEEERCELEEAENDTRLRCQQLEVEMAQLREREGALEVELGQARRSLSAAHRLQARLEMALQSLETRNFELEEAECELRASIAAVESALPAIVAFHLAHYKSYLRKREARAMLSLPVPVRSTAVSTEDDDGLDIIDTATDEAVDIGDEANGVLTDTSNGPPPRKRDDTEVLERLAQLVAAEQDMHQKIAFLEQKESAFQETLAAADGLWTEMELNYTRRLATAEEAEEELSKKVRRLEDSESKLRQALSEQATMSERVHELEAQERALLTRLRVLEQEKYAALEEACRFREEARVARAALAALQAHVDGPLAGEMAAERRRAQDLVEELRGRQEAIQALEQRTNTEISALQTQIAVGEKAMQDVEVTCAELREEVDTLEEAVASLRAQLSAAHDKAERDLVRVESALAERDRVVEQMRLASLASAAKASPASALDHEMMMAAASHQPEEDDDAPVAAPVAAPPAAPPAAVTPAPAVSLFRKSLQAFRNSEMMTMMMMTTSAAKPATPPKPVPKKENPDKPFASLPPMTCGPCGAGGVVRKTPPPLPPKNVAAFKWPRGDR